MPIFSNLLRSITPLFCAVAFLLVACRDRVREDIKDIERFTHVAFPKLISEIKISRPREFCISVRMRVDEREIQEFLTENHFESADGFPLNKSLGIDSQLFEKGNSGFYKLAGRDSDHRWEFALDPKRRLLWCVMLFQDSHGDPPP